MGKLIIIEGLDGCGKSTQTALLEKYFEDNSVKFKKIKLPEKMPMMLMHMRQVLFMLLIDLLHTSLIGVRIMKTVL